MGLRATAISEKCSESRRRCFKWQSDGINRRLVRSPVAPNRTSAQGGAGIAWFGASTVDTRSSAMGLTAGRWLDVTAELLAHGRKQLLGERVLPARAEAREKRRGDHVRRDGFLDCRHHGPAAFAGILDI